MLVKIIQEHCNTQRCTLCWRGLGDLNILYLFNVRCREYTFRYKKDS